MIKHSPMMISLLLTEYLRFDTRGCDMHHCDPKFRWLRKDRKESYIGPAAIPKSSMLAQTNTYLHILQLTVVWWIAWIFLISTSDNSIYTTFVFFLKHQRPFSTPPGHRNNVHYVFGKNTDWAVGQIICFFNVTVEDEYSVENAAIQSLFMLVRKCKCSLLRYLWKDEKIMPGSDDCRITKGKKILEFFFNECQ